MTRAEQQFKQWLNDAAALAADDEDFVAIGLTLLSLAISRLPPEEREDTLLSIEKGGALRRAVERYPNACHPPGHRWAQ
jgi:hypothetical protein